MNMAPTLGVEEDDEDDTDDRDKHLVARPVDLPTVQAEMLRRRNEEDQAVRLEKGHADRRHDAAEPTRTSVWQKEGDILRGPGEGAERLFGETVTAGEIHYAEAHRHQALNAAVGLAVSGLLGTNVDIGHARHHHTETADEARPDDADGADRLAEKGRERSRASEGGDGPAELDKAVLIERTDPEEEVAPGRQDQGERLDVPTNGQAAALRAKRLMTLELGHTLEPAHDREAAPEPDRDWDRDMEMTR